MSDKQDNHEVIIVNMETYNFW